ncbi:undecaprenyl-phosphate glucose phosphotransferase [Ferrimonas pelagia]|uniref:Exopolysaccharide biosynthesis glycosyltransferase VpsL n=1 Tax=Ferrimonas pelagia TaxID=1177826 RepID=A0ABP9EZ86_9GAMM
MISESKAPDGGGYGLRLLDLLVVVLPLVLLSLVGVDVGLPVKQQLVWGVVAALMLLYCSEVFSLYRAWHRMPFADMALATLVCWSVVVLTLVFCLYFLKLAPDLSRVAFVYWSAMTAIGLLVWRWGYRRYLQRQHRDGQSLKSALVIGATPMAERLVQALADGQGTGVEILGFCDDRETSRLPHHWQGKVIGDIEYAIARAEQGGIDKLYVALPMRAEARIREILARCANSVSEIHVVPDFFMFNLFNAAWHDVGGVKTLSVYESPIRGPWGMLKRAEDLAIAGVALTIFALPMLVIAVAIKLDSAGPVLFKQARYGIDGKKFEVWKFRSMTTMENGTTLKQATRNDGRITRLGAMLRRTSLDELPQFFNVLQGSMSVVGPRPHAVAHNEQYRALIQGYMLRHKVKPGITGWAQVNGWRGETDTLDKMAKRVEFDLHYITHWSVLFDIRIVAMTLVNGFLHENAY